jgi:hypothetical protein
MKYSRSIFLENWVQMVYQLYVNHIPSTKGKHIIVFRFIVEYSSLRDFNRPLGNNNNNRSIFLYEDFGKMIFWLVFKLDISYNNLKDFGFV